MSTFLGILGIVLYVSGLAAAIGTFKMWQIWKSQFRDDKSRYEMLEALVPYISVYGFLAFLAGTVALKKSGWTILVP